MRVVCGVLAWCVVCRVAAGSGNPTTTPPNCGGFGRGLKLMVPPNQAKHAPATSTAACCEACGSERDGGAPATVTATAGTACKSWTFHTAGPGKPPACWLHTAVGSTVTDPTATSGVNGGGPLPPPSPVPPPPHPGPGPGPGPPHAWVVNGSAVVNTVRDEYLSFNLDSTDDRGFFSRDLSQPELIWLTSQLTARAPAYLRVGGSGQNWLYTNVDNSSGCTRPGGHPLSGRDACLNASHWDMLNQFVRATNTSLIWGLRSRTPAVELRALLQYSIRKGYGIYGLEPSNEMGCPLLSYLADVVDVLRELYPNPATRPRLLGADTVGNPVGALQCFLNRTAQLGAPALAGTYHAYPGSVKAGLAQLAALRGSALPTTELWVGETARNSGGCGQDGTCGAFVDGFWWLPVLGGLAQTHTTFLRQTLIGGAYGLLRDGDPCGPCTGGDLAHPEHLASCTKPPCTGPSPEYRPFYPTGTPLAPNPDWWSSVLFKRLVGRRVLATPNVATRAPFFSAFCARGHPGGVVVVYATAAGATSAVNVTVSVGGGNDGDRLEYHLTSPGGCGAVAANATSGVARVALNGVTLTLATGSANPMPPLQPLEVPAGRPVTLPPCGYGFVVLPYANASACL